MKATIETSRPARLLDIVRTAHRMARAQLAREPSDELSCVRLKLQICEDILRSLEPPEIAFAPKAMA